MHHHWIARHPSAIPQERRPSPLLIEPPGRFSATRHWQQFRDELSSLLPAYAGDPNLPQYLKTADQVIAWRATVPPEGRFWAEERD
jgi:hypothetical protein